jgi:capsular polysaccharide biosynthesis protein
MNDAIVVGQGTVISKSGTLLAESAAEFLNHGLVPEGLHVVAPSQFALNVPPGRHISTPSLLVKRPWWRNYGHWLVDGAALLAMISAVQMPSKWQIVVGAHENQSMKKVINDTISLLAPGVPIIEQPDDLPWTFSSLHYITPVHIPPLFKLPVARNSLRALFLRDACPARAQRRIYVARDTRRGRTITNEQDLIEICRQRGFEVLSPEDFSVEEQATIFHESEVVVGIKGAALTNMLFSPNSVGIMVLSPGTFTDPFFWDLVSQNQTDYTEVFGAAGTALGPSPSSDFWISPETFRSELDALITRIARG